MGATVTLIIGPGGCGKTHRLQALAADHLTAETLVIVDDAHHLDETSVATLADTAATHGTVERVWPLDEPSTNSPLRACASSHPACRRRATIATTVSARRLAGGWLPRNTRSEIRCVEHAPNSRSPCW